LEADEDAPMEQLFTSGRIIDLILLLMLAEYLGLRLFLARATHGVDLQGVALYLLSGAFLLLALRVALTGGSWVWIGACLAAAGAWHLLDLRRRFAGSAPQPAERTERM
jgi:hypothetical protein